MRFSGRILKSEGWWAVEVPLLGIHTQGKTKKEAYLMLGDAIELLVNEKGFSVSVYPGKNGYLEVDSNQPGPLVALLLKQQRGKSGKTLEQVARALGQSSPNAYARYEKGRSTPTMEQLTKLLRALGSDDDLVIGLAAA